MFALRLAGVEVLLKKHRGVAVWIVGLLLYGGDFLVNRLPMWRPPWSVEVRLDRLIPFEPEWAWVYLFAWLLFIFGGGGWYIWKHRADWTAVRQLLCAAVVMQVGAWIIHLAMPTYMPRPPLPAHTGDASLRLMRRIYATDPSTHVLPSLHVASVAVLAWLLYLREGPAWTLPGGLMVALIALSVLFTKQHGLLDVAAGLLWACFAVRAGSGLEAFRDRGALVPDATVQAPGLARTEPPRPSKKPFRFRV